MDAKLLVAKGKTAQKQIALAGIRTIVGRKNDCNLRIPSPMVSRRHCELILAGERLLVKDLGSSNGTYVNGSRVKEKELRSGDTLGIGPLTFIIQLNDEPVGPSDTARPRVAAGAAEAVVDDAADFLVEAEEAPAEAVADFIPADDDASAVPAEEAADFVVTGEEAPADDAAEFVAAIEEAPAEEAAEFVVPAEAAAQEEVPDFVVAQEESLAAEAGQAEAPDFVVAEEESPAAAADFVVAEDATVAESVDFVVAEDATVAESVDFVAADEASGEGDTLHDATFSQLQQSQSPAGASEPPPVAESPTELAPAQPPKKKGGLFGKLFKKKDSKTSPDEPPGAAPLGAKAAPPATAIPTSAPESDTPASDTPQFVTDDAESPPQAAPQMGEDELADFLTSLNEKE